MEVYLSITHNIYTHFWSIYILKKNSLIWKMINFLEYIYEGQDLRKTWLPMYK